MNSPTHPRMRAAHSGAHKHERFVILGPGILAALESGDGWIVYLAQVGFDLA